MIQSTNDAYPAIAELVGRYADYCDHQRWSDAAGLFTPDGVIDAEAIFGETARGHAEIETFMATRPSALAHHPTSFYIEDEADGAYQVRMKMLVMFDGALSSIDYQWAVRISGGRAAIAHQAIAMVGRIRTGSPAREATTVGQ